MITVRGSATLTFTSQTAANLAGTWTVERGTGAYANTTGTGHRHGHRHDHRHRELRRHAADGHADLRRTTRPIGTTRRIHVRGVNPAVSPHNARTSAGA